MNTLPIDPVPSATVPADSWPSDSKPERAVRLGLIGCGKFSRTHARRIDSLPDATITAVADVDAAQIDVLVEAFPSLAQARRFSTHEDLLGTDVDGVIIVTPHGLHFPQVRDALDAGKHVLCEKPLVTKPDQARELAALANRRQLVLMIGYQQALLGNHRYAREQVMSGGLGDIVVATLTLHQHWVLPANSWRIGDLGEGGFLADTGNHFVDLVLHLTGLTPRYVTAMSDGGGSEVDAITGCLISCAGGRILNLALVGRGPASWRLTIVGTAGMIELHNQDGLRHVPSTDFSGWLDTPRQDISPPPAAWPDTTTPDHEFVKAIRTGDANRSDGARAVLVAEVIQAIYASARQGGTPVLVGGVPA